MERVPEPNNEQSSGKQRTARARPIRKAAVRAVLLHYPLGAPRPRRALVELSCAEYGPAPLQLNVHAAVAAVAALALRGRDADAGLAVVQGGGRRALGLQPELALGRRQREEALSAP